MKSTIPPDSTSPLPTATDGSTTIAEYAGSRSPAVMARIGKQTIKDYGNRLRQIQGLKPGGSSIRSDEMIDEILSRLLIGETMTSISCDDHMPALSTVWYWCRADEKLERDIKWAQGVGQRSLADLRIDISQGGIFSSGDVRRDDLMIRAINANIAQRNRSEFGERIQVDQTRVTVNMPAWSRDVACRPIEAAIEVRSTDIEGDDPIDA